MDHAVNSVRTYFELSMEELYGEWKSGEYDNLSNCPTYKECSTYKKAIDVMNGYIYGESYKSTPIKDVLEAYVWTRKNEQIVWK